MEEGSDGESRGCDAGSVVWGEIGEGEGVDGGPFRVVAGVEEGVACGVEVGGL